MGGRWAVGCLPCLLLLVTSPLWCCCLVNVAAYPLFYAQYGRGPGSDRLAEVQKGMTPEEVVALLGQQHKRTAEPDGTGVWIYYDDCLCYNYSGVKFDGHGRVLIAWVH